MFKNESELIKIIKKDERVLQALNGLSQITPHLHSLVEDFLIEHLSFRKSEKSYDKVHLLYDKSDTCELVQFHTRIAPKGKSSFRTSKFSLIGDWTSIAQVIIDNNFNVIYVILIERDIIEKNNTDRPWTIGKCLKLGDTIYPNIKH